MMITIFAYLKNESKTECPNVYVHVLFVCYIYHLHVI